MRHFFEQVLDNDSNSSNKNFQNIFLNLFGTSPETVIELPLVWNNLKEIIRNATLNLAEKKYIEEYFNSRRNEIFQGIPDAKKFNTNFKTNLFDLLNNKDEIEASKLVAYLGPRLIHENYGEAVLFWVWFYFSNSSWDYNKLQVFEKYIITRTKFVKSKEEFDILENARKTMKIIHQIHEPIYTLALYDLCIKTNQLIKEIKLNKYIKDNNFSIEVDFTEKGYTMGPSKKWSGRNYGLNGESFDENYSSLGYEYANASSLGRAMNWEGRDYTVYLDSLVGIILKYRGLPVAVVGFSIKDEETLFINQFQQVSYSLYDRFGRSIGRRTDEIGKTIDWQDILYKILCDFSKNIGYKNIVIQKGKYNHWINQSRTILDVDNRRIYNKQIDIPHLSIKVAEKVYDVFALNNGFKNGEYGNWQKSLI